MMATETTENTGTMILPSASAAALWEGEIAGALSGSTWENVTTHEYWLPWQHIKVVVTPGIARVDSKFSFLKTNYNLHRLTTDYDTYVRMLRMGRMGLALASLKRELEKSDYYDTIMATEYMPDTYEEWASRKTWNEWERMDLVSDELARAYYDQTYNVDDLTADLRQIMAAMRTAKHS